jgi:hypothetical protein
MISIALKEANRVAKTSVDRHYHTLIQQRHIFFGIGKRVTILLPIFFYRNRDRSLPRLGLGRVVTPPGFTHEL